LHDVRGSLKTGDVRLQEVRDGDLPVFSAYQLDPEANKMVAFTAPDPADRGAFDRHWARILADAAIVIRTVLVCGEAAGNVLVYEEEGRKEVSYWLGREFLGPGYCHQGAFPLSRRDRIPTALRARGEGQLRLASSAGEVRVHDPRRGARLRQCPRRRDRQGRAGAGGRHSCHRQWTIGNGSRTVLGTVSWKMASCHSKGSGK